MLFTHEEIEAVAPHVTSEAQGQRGLENPFITLRDLETLCQGNEILEMCLRDVVMQTLRYAETICLFVQIVARGQSSNEDDTRTQIEAVRTASHDATIASVNLLSRQLKTSGLDNTWIKKLSTGRPAYTKFAMLIAFEVVNRGGSNEQ
ncbi:MAG: hypothetical protein Q7S72_00330 [Candidatus Taylorbacteria bacterium]|nr:hypothetical protein [Candidatus Taylorbacteria bacterium]